MGAWLSARRPAGRALLGSAGTLIERENELLGVFMKDLMRWKEWARADGNWDRLLKPDDHSGFADVAFVPVPLPKDKDGFVLSFDVADTEGIRSFFEKHGLVVVRGVLDTEACARSRDEVWDLLEREVRGLDRQDPSTWERWAQLAWGGFVGNTFPLSPQLCANRQQPKLHAAFEAVFGRRELHVNVGRIGAMRPTRNVAAGPVGPDGNRSNVDKPEWRTLASGQWLHWDCNPWTGATSSFSWALRDAMANRGYMYSNLSVQAILALGDCGENDGGFYCVPGSHKVLRAWAHANLHEVDRVTSSEGPMQYKLPLDDALLQAGEKAPIREGDLLIWNTATAHCNFPNDSERMRIVQFIQMKPADDPVFGPLLQTEALLPPGFALTQLGRKLLGLDPW